VYHVEESNKKKKKIEGKQFGEAKEKRENDVGPARRRAVKGQSQRLFKKGVNDRHEKKIQAIPSADIRRNQDI